MAIIAGPSQCVLDLMEILRPLVDPSEIELNLGFTVEVDVSMGIIIDGHRIGREEGDLLLPPSWPFTIVRLPDKIDIISVSKTIPVAPDHFFVEQLCDWVVNHSRLESTGHTRSFRISAEVGDIVGTFVEMYAEEF